MKELNLFYKLKDAYAKTTKANNLFYTELNRIKWCRVYEDNENKNYMFKSMVIIVPHFTSYNNYPYAVFRDGSKLLF